MQDTALLGLFGSIAIALLAACAGSDGDSEDPGRCGVRILPLGDDERAARGKAFADRNGSDWRVIEIDAFAGHVVRARRTIDGPGEVVQIDRADAVDMALAAIRGNADLLSLSEADISALALVGAFHNPGAGPLQWMLEFLGQAPIPGYEELDNRRRLRVVVDIAKDGMIMGLVNHSEILPPFDICTTPMLAADDPRLRHDVLGRELYYSDFIGNPQYAGTVEDHNIVATERVIYVDRSRDSRLIIRLTYRIDVAFDLLTWSFFVDPDTGAVLAIEQNFVT